MFHNFFLDTRNPKSIMCFESFFNGRCYLQVIFCPTYRILSTRDVFSKHIIVKKINSLHLNLYLTSDAPASLSDTASSVASSSGTSSNTKSKNLL